MREPEREEAVAVPLPITCTSCGCPIAAPEDDDAPRCPWCCTRDVQVGPWADGSA